MKVFVAGATGVIGRQLLPLLATAGHAVTGLTRSKKRRELISRAGGTPVVGDALDTEQLTTLVRKAKPHVVIGQLTDIPPRLNPRKIGAAMASTNRLRTDGTRNLVQAARAAGAARVVTQSISFAYRPRGDGVPALVSEDEPLYLDAPAAFADLVRAVDVGDRSVIDAPDIEGIVLRYGLFYGPGTAYDEGGSFRDDVIHRRVPVVGTGEGVFSFIHVRDAAAATWAAVERGSPGIYHVVDDDPVPVGEWLPWFAETLGAPPPRRIPAWLARLVAGPYVGYFMTQQRGAQSHKAKQVLGWEPHFGSWREGMAPDRGG